MKCPHCNKEIENEEKQLVVYGNAEINSGIELLKELRGGTAPRQQYERYALNRLIKSYGSPRVEKAIRFAFKIHTLPFAPSIYSYRQLEEKWPQLEDFGLKLKNQVLSKSKGAFHENL